MALTADHQITTSTQTLGLGSSTDDILLTIVPSSTEPFTHNITFSVNHVPKSTGVLSVFNNDIGPENTIKIIAIIVNFYKTPAPTTTTQTVNVDVTLTKNGVSVFSNRITGANPTVVYEEIDIILS